MRRTEFYSLNRLALIILLRNFIVFPHFQLLPTINGCASKPTNANLKKTRSIFHLMFDSFNDSLFTSVLFAKRFCFFSSHITFSVFSSIAISFHFIYPLFSLPLFSTLSRIISEIFLL